MDADKHAVADRPETESETEITPEMIEAGVDELTLSFSTEGDLDDKEDVVRAVYQAMTRAIRRRAASSVGE
jgi:hypothetical protein